MRRLYGAGVAHAAVLVVSFVIAGAAVLTLGVDALWNSDRWWQSIAVWFVGAAILHDLVLYPLYSLADRATRPTRNWTVRQVPVRQHIRAPALGAALTLLVFFPGILNTDDTAIVAATGLGRDPYLERWLWLVAAIVAISVAVFLVRVLAAARRPSRGMPRGHDRTETRGA
ncbi:hypothetical protein HQ325_04360 [Rhodococcus sp. BP-349]|uniref:hypothetical protein n=1 Tax=unclassified Rhodococcus (in: high G+C Gram-positive bacteria) TaxID=192944 RepID=UPI001C9A5802|nr:MULTISPECIES: hypothetical protein [unclassified Rhodococcus (in: high G+C Gram-positive bacteria)]MBY6537898.1 hypothetical protein [Rhodococcus sp. BP-363]MBY6542235.1 hypothetical protein [Rhodococcus sp. BP-369]MBY6561465.1 hypothetical protein [Rhodococcus sp. BP-370]MBY6575757.1 hypothetical protein [Rhodococcus sp. BP-364]MBY6585058.1 hypothetical protein [Rhodococcus sp. BP-358]